RGDPILAADLVFERAAAALEHAHLPTGDPFLPPRWHLGEVGWASFDGDEAARARFVRRLWRAAAQRAEGDPRFGGLLWFKDADTAPFVYPRWDEAPNPLGGGVVPCETPLLGPIACTAEVFALMGRAWGLFG